MQIPDDWKLQEQALAQRVILVTGAGSGIGAAVALQAAQCGATVILLDKNVAALERLYDSIEAAGAPQPAIYPMDLEGARESDYRDLSTTLDENFGRLDGLLHNAAMLGALTPLTHFDTELWYKILQVNLSAPFLMTRACLDLLARSDSASVIFNSDRVGRHGKAYWGAYGISKAALENMMQILADELETNTTIRINSIDPGPVATPLRSIAYPGEDPSTVASPEDVARPYLYLLGPDSRGISGKQFEIHGFAY